MSELLPCPACGEPCQTLPPNRPTTQYDHPWWESGQYATCQCGADVIVDADGESAWLELRGEARAWLAPPFDLTERAGFQPGFVRMNRYSAEASK